MAFRPFFFCLILHILTVATDVQPRSYETVDDVVLNCGSTGNRTAQDSRSWFGDINSNFFPLDQSQNNASTTSDATVESSAQIDPVPYGTARLSRSEFSYTIPVTPGPKFVRLYFYASNYENFDRSKAFFSVKTDHHTLLNNFSTSLTAVFPQQQLMKEFSVTVEKSSLNITFAPTASISEAFAFINGIEVVSMPTNLSYPDVENGQQGIVFAGTEIYLPLQNNTALETSYRINIGGRAISPGDDDTGMFRKWDDEIIYLTKRGVSVLPVITSAKLQFTAIPAYTAPEEVYKTARSMGAGNSSRDEVLRYNLTWEFPVDNGFNYLVRLHFCEIVPEVKKSKDRVFNIFLANQSAETRFDIIEESGGMNVPYKRDYAVSMFIGDGEKKVNLSVALQPISDLSFSYFLDAILNGIEIFKINSTEGNLAAPNPDPVLLPTPIVPPSTQPKKNKSNLLIISIVGGVVSGVVALSIIAFLILRRGRKFKDNATSDGTTKWGPISFSTTKSTKTRGSSSLPSELCRYFSLAEIKAATNNFDDILIIGVGGFGDVYKGYIDGGTTPVAIKRLKAESSQGVHEFKTEIEMLSHLRHLHLVSLIGYCNDNREMILVYDYMARGTLRSHLYNSENPPLSWIQRLQICIGAARGLHYLHKGAKYSIIHRDVKTTNILLDEKWVAKVSDFGLSKMGPTTMSKAHVSTVVKGSFGYLDPEYYRRQQLSEKSDVYSFGVVLCEVLCGRPPIIRTVERKQMSLAEWASSSYKNGTLYQIVDPYLTGKIALECLKKYGEIAISCMLDNGAERPSMNDVVWSLEFALQLQQNAEDNNCVGGASVGLKEEEEVAFINNNSDSIFTCSWEDTPGSESIEMSKISSEQSSSANDLTKRLSRAVFSEIGDPKGR